MNVSKLSVMTVSELAEKLAHHLDYKQIWKNEFPACDFCIIDAERKETYTEVELEYFYQNGGSWHGIKTFDPGFGNNSIFVASDYWGGGNCSMVELYDGIDAEETYDLLLEALLQTLSTNDTVYGETLLLVESKTKEDHRKIWMRMGVTLHVNETEEACLLMPENTTNDVAKAILRSIISEGRYEAEGESYIPAACITSFNEEYDTKYEDCWDAEFII